MQREAPEFQRCCFCLPLRKGLIAWGYVKVGINILMMTYATYSFFLFLNRFRSARSSTPDIVIYTIICVCLLTDTAFNILFIVAGHTKSIKLLKISYIYNMVVLGLLTLVACLLLYEHVYYMQRAWSYIEYRAYLIIDLLMSLGFIISVIFLQIYVILLTRSEMVKLQSQILEMQFTNHLVSGEPECTLHNTSNADKKQTVQNYCTDE